MTTITLPSSLTEAYGDVMRAAYPSQELPESPRDLTVDHLDDLRCACLFDIAALEGTLGINGWQGRTIEEIDSEDPGSVMCLRQDCMASRRLLAWTETQLRAEGSDGKA